ncbi:YbaB/EbfC family nucleoid-associated protein [Actinopolymorpha sp. NPDC004070]|uniref:YbaB/EbfC family nucleoid-associated protein n=1 Tax=Actinopolymorpha sp. NPDC004070 TaxID=3154548 RepID=UPI0033ABA42C
MTDPWGASADMVGRLQEQLARARQASAPDDPDAASAPAGTGEVLDGRLRVTLTAGRVSAVHLDPRALRLPSEDLAAAIQEAVNAAIDAHNEQATAGLPGVPPLAELSRTLDEVTDASRRAMAQSAQAMREALAGVQRVSELHRRRPAG